MKKSLSIIFLILYGASLYSAGVSYGFSRGRFGDNLKAFSRALWVSYKTGVPVVYRPFSYSRELKLDQLHGPSTFKKYKRKKQIKLWNEEHIELVDKERDCLYVIPWKSKIMPDWNDKGFVELLKDNILPRQPQKFWDLPEDRLCVAAHIRVGSGGDKILANNDKSLTTRTHHADKKYPGKFPPLEYFIEQIRRLSQILDNQPLYVHLFTDSKEPEKLIAILEDAVYSPTITYGYNKSNQRDVSGVLEDFFNMARFDYLIRGGSSFSYMAEKISDCKISIYPAHVYWNNGPKVGKVITTYFDR
ncbi:hypothetical protein KC622_01785 [Candidatus Dojkabacteria bacterium]|uniref:Uncharacterized protein n=1 Tax=Candidatus Dojkabacteria bacterium TaxID=2099670 RepID=A0A955HZL8_9BACT|nr:hypothetical protein [Candidatus Dojkabacteria bacterium]